MNSQKNIKLYFLIIVSSLIMLNCNNMDVLFDITEPVTDTIIVNNSVNATSSADIVMIIDTSGSMGQEVDNVQAYLDSNLIGPLESHNIDYHFILIAEEDPLKTISIEVPQSLKDNPRFFHINRFVASHPKYDILLDELPGLITAGSIRAQSTLYFIVITDDDDTMTYANFKTTLTDPAGINRDFYSINGLVGTPESVQAEIYDLGTPYINGANDTGGMIFDITAEPEEWSDLFDTLSETIAEQMKHTFFLAKDAIKRGIAVYVNDENLKDPGIQGDWAFSSSGNYIIISDRPLYKDDVVRIEYLTVVPPE